MSEYRAPLQDMEFILNNVLEVQNSKIPGYKDLDNEFLVSILIEAGKICSDVLFPLNHIGDSEGCVFCLLYTSPSPRDMRRSRMPSSA